MEYRHIGDMYQGYEETSISLLNYFRTNAIPSRTRIFNLFQNGHHLIFVHWTNKYVAWNSIFNVISGFTLTKWYISSKRGPNVYIEHIEFIRNGLFVCDINILNIEYFISVGIFLVFL